MIYDFIRLDEHPDKFETAAAWFHSKWGIPYETYLESMNQSLSKDHPIPEWYVLMEKDRIVAGAGIVDNDFHDRKDLTPNVAAVYVEEDRRNRGFAAKLLDFIAEDMRDQGILTLYLLTDLTGFYEKCGWDYFCEATSDGQTRPSRIYVHTMPPKSEEK